MTKPGRRLMSEGFERLRTHVGHDIECAVYGKNNSPTQNVAVECVTCGVVLIDYDRARKKLNRLMCPYCPRVYSPSAFVKGGFHCLCGNHIDLEEMRDPDNPAPKRPFYEMERSKK